MPSLEPNDSKEDNICGSKTATIDRNQNGCSSSSGGSNSSIVRQSFLRRWFSNDSKSRESHLQVLQVGSSSKFVSSTKSSTSSSSPTSLLKLRSSQNIKRRRPVCPQSIMATKPTMKTTTTESFGPKDKTRLDDNRPQQQQDLKKAIQDFLMEGENNNILGSSKLLFIVAIGGALVSAFATRLPISGVAFSSRHWWMTIGAILVCGIICLFELHLGTFFRSAQRCVNSRSLDVPLHQQDGVKMKVSQSELQDEKGASIDLASETYTTTASNTTVELNHPCITNTTATTCGDNSTVNDGPCEKSRDDGEDDAYNKTNGSYGSKNGRVVAGSTIVVKVKNKKVGTQNEQSSMSSSPSLSSLQHIRNQNSVLDLVGSSSSASECDEPTKTLSSTIIEDKDSNVHIINGMHNSSSFSSSDDGLPLNQAGYISFLAESSTRSGGRTTSTSTHSAIRQGHEGDSSGQSDDEPVPKDDADIAAAPEKDGHHTGDDIQTKKDDNSNLELAVDESLSAMIQETVSKMEESSKRMRQTMAAFNAMSSTGPSLSMATNGNLLDQFELDSDHPGSGNGEYTLRTRLDADSSGLISLALKRLRKPIVELDDDDDDDGGHGDGDGIVDIRDDDHNLSSIGIGIHGGLVYDKDAADRENPEPFAQASSVLCNSPGEKHISNLSTMIEKLRKQDFASPSGFTTTQANAPNGSFESCPDDEKRNHTERNKNSQLQDSFAAALESLGVDDKAILKVAKEVEHSVHRFGGIVMDTHHKQHQKS